MTAYPHVISSKLDAAATWQRDTAYTPSDQFSWEATQATAVDINGDVIEQGKLYNLRYKVGKTSLDAAAPTLAEFALMEIVGPVDVDISTAAFAPETLLIDTDAVDQTLYPFAGGLNWGEVKAQFAHIRFDLTVSDHGVANVKPYSITMTPAQLERLQTHGGWAILSQSGVVVWVDGLSNGSTGMVYRQTSGDNPTNGNMRFTVSGIVGSYPVAIPTMTTVRDTVTVTVNGGATTILSGATAFTGTTNALQIELPPGLVLGSAIADNGATAIIASARTGLIELSVPAGTVGPVNIAVASITGSTVSKIHDWETVVNNGEHTFAILPELKFKFGDVHRQLTARATGADVIATEVWSRWEQGGEAQADTTSITFVSSQDRNVAPWDINFSVAGANETTWFVVDGKKVKLTAYVDQFWVNNMIEIWVEE